MAKKNEKTETPPAEPQSAPDGTPPEPAASSGSGGAPSPAPEPRPHMRPCEFAICIKPCTLAFGYSQAEYFGGDIITEQDRVALVKNDPDRFRIVRCPTRMDMHAVMDDHRKEIERLRLDAAFLGFEIHPAGSVIKSRR